MTLSLYGLRKNEDIDFFILDNKRIKKIRKTFIHSYVVLKSQKELFDSDKGDRKHFRTKLEGGKQEVLVVTPINKKQEDTHSSSSLNLINTF